MGMNVAQTMNSAATMSQYQHSQRQSQEGSDMGIFRRIPPASILPQLFELNIINILFGNLETAVRFLLDSVGIEKLAISNFIEKHELAIFSTIKIFDNPIYSGDVLFNPDGLDLINSSSGFDSSGGGNDGGGSWSDTGNYSDTQLMMNPELFSSHMTPMQDFNSSDLGNLSPHPTPRMPNSPFEEKQNFFDDKDRSV